ncbi:hypothetical protein CEXT_779411 [Caerostris extrusa]|uniref:Uncharacterized protein n=1 Tax=Caerostris extrusa TaxID=172846 RepID=A0AAV4VLU6_CAEEX|nr:hypothetical protein CEXT_779411 [Caerostris extrusa]
MPVIISKSFTILHLWTKAQLPAFVETTIQKQQTTSLYRAIWAEIGRGQSGPFWNRTALSLLFCFSFDHLSVPRPEELERKQQNKKVGKFVGGKVFVGCGRLVCFQVRSSVTEVGSSSGLSLLSLGRLVGVSSFLSSSFLRAVQSTFFLFEM